MIRWVEPETVEEAVRAFARDLRTREPSVVQVFWYGSWVSGTPTPSSDVDLCIVLRDDERRPRDRLPDFLPARFPVGIDLVVLTEEELRKLERRAPSWYEAITKGKAV